jgi:hypothetical protein
VARADIPCAIQALRGFGAGKTPLPADEIDAPEAQGDLVLTNTSMPDRET